MSTLAAIVDWRRAAPDPASLRRLLAGTVGQSPDGFLFAAVPHALFGLGRRFVRQAERLEPQPFVDRQQGVCAVGDIRLDNRGELVRAIGDLSGRISDLRILVAGYERWGVDLASRLVGDFAFAIWDWRRRRLYAARDAFGVRPLVYRAVGSEIILATDPAQILALPDTDRTPDDQTVVDSLAWSYTHYGATFFRQISSLRPGHFLVADAETIRQTRYFEPPSEPIHFGRFEDYLDGFRFLFRQAVQDRLDAEGPIVAHLSGGLDSSSIVCQANAIQRSTFSSSDLMPIVTASAVFAGQRHDETPYIAAVRNHVGFRARTWDGNAPSGWEFSAPALGMPGSNVSFNGGSVGDIEIAREEGARVILAGEGGDYVTGEMGLFNDLLMRGHWLTLAAQIRRASSPIERGRRGRSLRQAIREEVPPGLLALWRRRRGPSSSPGWLQPQMRERWIPVRVWTPPATRRWLSRLQRGIWGYLTMPRMAWVADFASACYGNAGLEVRFPFLDLRLVRFMLSVPVEHRLMGQLSRWTHREALRSILPAAIANRDSKPGFRRAIAQWGRRSQHSIRDLFKTSGWASSRFVDPVPVQQTFERLVSTTQDTREANDAWLEVRSIVFLEVWLRAVLSYRNSEEVFPMADVEQKDSEPGPVAVEGRPPVAYVPPALVRIGNVNQLLASSGSPGNDSGGGPGLGIID